MVKYKDDVWTYNKLLSLFPHMVNGENNFLPELLLEDLINIPLQMLSTMYGT